MNRYSPYPLPRKPFTPRPLTELMSSSAELAALQAGVRQVAALEAALQAVLPGYLASHVHAGPIKDQALTLFAAHNALAARLRHLEPTVLAELQQRGFALRAIKIRVRPQAPAAAAQIKQARVSAAGADCLRELADALEPSPLQQAVARMAQRHTGRRRA
ncbi:DUF721 domain-containing protein [Mycetohabitans sp. B5]|uniref:Uncharacterized protein DUF721 n=1 Tax=Mycetohabitans endofungorum TaxID=417203 RepID=A0A2P5K9H2_9BURK|nr:MULTISPECIES: DciA family protein [Mycetohabitans]MCG1053639.1 DUF721 domain-containing protein [Mycetohabitans sp. B5]PPB83361.1 uncharacterized protein DUF721 [Mycetohabitans endofungorum]